MNRIAPCALHPVQFTSFIAPYGLLLSAAGLGEKIFEREATGEKREALNRHDRHTVFI